MVETTQGVTTIYPHGVPFRQQSRGVTKEFVFFGKRYSTRRTLESTAISWLDRSTEPDSDTIQVLLQQLFKYCSKVRSIIWHELEARFQQVLDLFGGAGRYFRLGLF